MANKMQIGWIVFRHDMVFRDSGWACAAWYRDISVKAGAYPLYIEGMTVAADGRVGGQEPQKVKADLDGVIVSDNFGSYICGNPVGGYDIYQNSGKEDTYFWDMYIFSFAGEICKGKEWEDGTSFQLLPEYEARAETYYSDLFGRNLTLHHLYKAV